jgi:hypothetical protein
MLEMTASSAMGYLASHALHKQLQLPAGHPQANEGSYSSPVLAALHQAAELNAVIRAKFGAVRRKTGEEVVVEGLELEVFFGQLLAGHGLRQLRRRGVRMMQKSNPSAPRKSIKRHNGSLNMRSYRESEHLHAILFLVPPVLVLFALEIRIGQPGLDLKVVACNAMYVRGVWL